MKPCRAVRPTFSTPAIVGGLVVGMILGLAGGAAAQDELKVATVNMAKIFKEYSKTKELDAKIEESRRAIGNEIEDRRQRHHGLVEDLARIDRDLNDRATGANERTALLKKRESNVDETSKLETEIDDYRLEHERALREMTLRARTQVVEEIMVIVNARVESAHYDLVLNRSAQGTGFRPAVLYANNALDITDDLIATLNRTHPATSGPSPAPSP